MLGKQHEVLSAAGEGEAGKGKTPLVVSVEAEVLLPWVFSVVVVAVE